MVTLEIEQFTPIPKDGEEIRIKEILNTFGQETLNLIQTFEYIRIESQTVNNPFNAFQIIHAFISALATRDPNPAHYENIRTILKEVEPSLLEDNLAIDMLARALSDNCRALKHKLDESMPKDFGQLLEATKKESASAVLKSGKDSEALLEILDLPEGTKIGTVFKRNGMHLWDQAYLEILNEIGKNGKEAAGKLKPIFKERYNNDKASGKIDLSYWLNTGKNGKTQNPIYTTPTLQLLTKKILKDEIKRKLNFKKKNIPAIGINIHHTLLKTLKGTAFLDEKDQVKIIYQENQIACAMPTISPDLMNTVFKGAGKLNTVIGHRCLRHLIKKPFEQIIAGQKDFRVLWYERGIKELAEEIGLKNNHQSYTDLNQIINALAYLEFSFPNSSGNLIQLTKYRSKRTHRLEHYAITVGLQFLPYWVNNNEKGSDRLLIPLIQDPPLVKPTQYYAHQYMLQLEIMEEFSNQSEILKKEGAIYLPTSKWEQLGNQCSLKQNVLKKVKDRWTQDGDDKAQFLKPVDKDFYTLGMEHNKALEFLENQGQIKITNKKRGEKCTKIKALGG